MVINKNGTSALSGGTYTVTRASTPVPEVTDLSPVVGINDVDIAITVTGANFNEALSRVTLASADGTIVKDLGGDGGGGCFIDTLWEEIRN